MVLMVLVSPMVNPAGMYNALAVIRAFVDFIGDACNGNPVQKNLTCKVHSLKVFSSFKIEKMKELSMQILNPHAAGIDVGSRSHLVAVDQNVELVKEFGVYTADHQKLVEHLRQYNITTIAMESTGNYWQTLFNALQQAGFEVMLVNGRYIKNVKGKKTDVLDCMWIQNYTVLVYCMAAFCSAIICKHFALIIPIANISLGKLPGTSIKCKKLFD